MRNGGFVLVHKHALSGGGLHKYVRYPGLALGPESEIAGFRFKAVGFGSCFIQNLVTNFIALTYLALIT